MKSTADPVRVIALVEGVSFLVLLGVAMPLKYFADMPQPVKIVGWAHGVLFMLLGVGVAWKVITRRWNFGRACIVVVASLLPFGPFLIDRRVLMQPTDTPPNTDGHRSPHTGQRT